MGNKNAFMRITYNSINKGKKEELKAFYKDNSKWFESAKIKFEFQKIEVHELQSGTLEEIVKHKAKEAYKKIKRPVLVEHTCLRISALNDLPNHLTSEMWNALGGHKICELVRSSSTNRAEAVTMLGYCDGKKIETFEGKCFGTISEVPRGDSNFQWDTIFVPDEQNYSLKTFAEMTQSEGTLAEQIKKRDISMRTKALKLFFAFLEKNYKNKSKTIDRYLKYQENYEKHIGELRKKIESGNLVLFIGAGLSRNLEFPSWGELIKEVGNVLGYKDDFYIDSGDYFELAEYGAKDISHLIKEVFKLRELKSDKENNGIDKINEKYMKPFRENMEKSNLYTFINKLGCKSIYTTNYERSIEEAIRYHNNKDSDSNVKTIIHNYLNDDTKKLFTENKSEIDNYYKVYKFHGDLNFEDSIIVTSEQYDIRYEEIIKNKCEIANKSKCEVLAVKNEENNKENENCLCLDLNKQLYNDLEDKTFLFIGYGFGDCDVNKILKYSHAKSTSENLKHYAFMVEPNEIKENKLKNMGIKSIVPPTGDYKIEVENFLRELNKKDKDTVQNEKKIEELKTIKFETN